MHCPISIQFLHHKQILAHWSLSKRLFVSNATYVDPRHLLLLPPTHLLPFPSLPFPLPSRLLPVLPVNFPSAPPPCSVLFYPHPTPSAGLSDGMTPPPDTPTP
eukprot:750926-Hanusia_phi.AAC.1